MTETRDKYSILVELFKKEILLHNIIQMLTTAYLLVLKTWSYEYAGDVYRYEKKKLQNCTYYKPI